jgi:hypothetical protein
MWFAIGLGEETVEFLILGLVNCLEVLHVEAGSFPFGILCLLTLVRALLWLIRIKAKVKE